MKAIEQIYENYKASQNEETPYSEEQKREFDKLSVTLDKVFQGEIQEDYRKQQQIFESSVAFSRASEKAGFILGFKMAIEIIQECK